MELYSDPQSEPELKALLIESRERWNAVLTRLGLPVRTPITEGRATRPFVAAHARDLRKFERNLLELAHEGQDLRDSGNLLTYSLNYLGLRCPDDFTDSVEPDDVVEGYGLDQRQIFRNFRFMEMCGYDLHDIMTYDWMTLYERPQRITNQLLERIEYVARTGQSVSLEDVPVHFLKERMSEHRQVLEMKCRRVGPIFEGPGRCTGFVFSCAAAFVDEAPERHELRFI